MVIIKAAISVYTTDTNPPVKVKINTVTVITKIVVR